MWLTSGIGRVEDGGYRAVFDFTQSVCEKMGLAQLPEESVGLERACRRKVRWVASVDTRLLGRYRFTGKVSAFGRIYPGLPAIANGVDEEHFPAWSFSD
jgi:hypothetical protein